MAAFMLNGRVEELQQKLYGPQSLTDLSSGPLWENFANSWSRERRLLPNYSYFLYMLCKVFSFLHLSAKYILRKFFVKSYYCSFTQQIFVEFQPCARNFLGAWESHQWTKQRSLPLRAFVLKVRSSSLLLLTTTSSKHVLNFHCAQDTALDSGENHGILIRKVITNP